MRETSLNVRAVSLNVRQVFSSRFNAFHEARARLHRTCSKTSNGRNERWNVRQRLTHQSWKTLKTLDAHCSARKTFHGVRQRLQLASPKTLRRCSKAWHVRKERLSVR
ncbi:MAG TPA: hypothetical protein VMB50_02740 [Myxococcales bacterium]|nr:hypothetical protein [Myxococcales bacterium]